ncbi:MAG: iron-sulfur cluster assembly accessory protein [Holosporaceae bacterium]|jgi:iron-sulfur cluster assembly protein|nr:iron-sulfur cluster assembly accessory protein [Holosporaceae bacterium]
MERPVNITEKAAAFIRKAVAEEEGCSGMRINVVSGGCGGATYELTFVKEINPSDLVSEEDGFDLYIASEALIFIMGMTLDYVSGPMGGGIVFENPNAKSTCKCGKSFCSENSDAPCGDTCAL